MEPNQPQPTVPSPPPEEAIPQPQAVDVPQATEVNTQPAPLHTPPPSETETPQPTVPQAPQKPIEAKKTTEEITKPSTSHLPMGAIVTGIILFIVIVVLVVLAYEKTKRPTDGVGIIISNFLR